LDNHNVSLDFKDLESKLEEMRSKQTLKKKESNICIFNPVEKIITKVESQSCLNQTPPTTGKKIDLMNNLEKLNHLVARDKSKVEQIIALTRKFSQKNGKLPLDQ